MYDHQVCVIDNLRYGHLRFDTTDLQHISFLKADIQDRDRLEKIMEDFQPEIIIHLAAMHYIPECEQCPSLAAAINVEGTLNLLTLCPERCRFVFTSSGAVYRPQDVPHHEVQSPVGPMDVYGFTKLHGEDFVRYFCQLRAFPAVIVRLFNVVGPGETNPHLWPEIFAQLRCGKTTLALGNLTPKRDYVDVRDVVEGFWAVASSGEVTPGSVVTVNLGSSKAYSVNEVIEKIRTVNHTDIAVIQDTQRVRNVDRPFLTADISQIRRLFSWEPKHDIMDSINAMLDEPDLSPSLLKEYKL